MVVSVVGVVGCVGWYAVPPSMRLSEDTASALLMEALASKLPSG